MTRAAAVLAVVASACNLAPAYHRPAAPVPKSWPSGEAYAHASGAAAAGLPWRTLVGNGKLTTVVSRALANNRNLRAAVANVAAVWAQYRVQRSGRIPTVSAGVDATVGQSDLFGAHTFNQSYRADVGISAFEIDLFGRQKNLSKSAFESYLASEEGLRSARIALIAQVITTYATLAANRELLDVSRKDLDSAEKSLAVAVRLDTAGVGNKLAVHQAETVVAQSRADVFRLATKVAQNRNALDLLVGEPVPDELLPTALGELEATIAQVPAGLSSDVLLQRPDVLAAEHQLRAAHADIGVARAALFPRISLTAAIGLASDALSSLVDGAFWSASPSADLPLFGSGNDARVDVAKANRDALVAAYEAAIQAAFRDVADALARAGTVRDQLEAQRALVTAAEQTYVLSESRFKGGIDSYLSVLTAQRTYYGAQQSLIGVRLEAVVNRVDLYQAIGNDPSVASNDGRDRTR